MSLQPRRASCVCAARTRGGRERNHHQREPQADAAQRRQNHLLLPPGCPVPGWRSRMRRVADGALRTTVAVVLQHFPEKPLPSHQPVDQNGSPSRHRATQFWPSIKRSVADTTDQHELAAALGSTAAEISTGVTDKNDGRPASAHGASYVALTSWRTCRTRQPSRTEPGLTAQPQQPRRRAVNVARKAVHPPALLVRTCVSQPYPGSCQILALMIRNQRRSWGCGCRHHHRRRPRRHH